MARSIRLDIIGDSRSLERAVGRSKGAIGGLSASFGQLAKATLVVDAVQAALRGLEATLHLGVSEFSENAKIAAQTAAAVKSTGGVANVTAKQIEALGQSLSNLSGVDDEVIRHGENLLLSFTNIRNFAGKNNDIFTQASKVMVDFSVRTGRDAASAAVILGRALEDPATRVASLSRAGVVFTRQQVSQLKAIEKTQGVLAAQKVLLKQLEDRFGGAGKAAGQTLPGQLNILRERFKDLAGSIVGVFAPSFSKAVTSLTDFVRRLSAAQTTKMRLHIVLTGLEHLGQDIVAAVQAQIDKIQGLDAVAGKLAARLGATVREKLSSINWHREIAHVAQQIGNAITDNLQRLNEAIRTVNWNKVGQEIAKGVGLAIAAAVVFIKNLNVGRITKAVADVLGAALLAAAKILGGIGQAIGQAVLKGVEAGLAAAKNKIIRIADDIALKIIEPFTHLPFGIGGPAQAAKKALEQQLADMAKVAEKGSAKVVKALAPVGKAIASRNFSAGFSGADTSTTPLPPPLPAPAGRKGISQTQKNTFFDNAISRILLRGGLGDIKQQISALENADSLIAARLKVTKDVTRRLTLEDELLQNAAQIKNLKAQQAAEALQKQQDARNKALAALTKKQFRQLGLGPEGDAIVPGVGNLKKRLGQITQNVSQSSLDTPALRSKLAAFRKVLSEGLVPKDVRAKIQEMLDGIAQQLKDHTGDVTKFAHANSNAILAGLGLSPEQARKLRQRISQVGAGGMVPGQQSLAFSGAGATVVHTTVELDGRQVAKSVTKHQQKNAKTRTSSRRG